MLISQHLFTRRRILSELKHKRDAQATRAAILEAAKRAFTAHGYEAASVRRIAADVGVNQALVNRYFGNKQTLFQEALTTQISFAPFFEGPKSEFGLRIASVFATKEKHEENLDHTMALCKSLGTPELAEFLRDDVTERFIQEIAGYLDGANRDQRAALILSQLVGFDISRRIIGTPSLGPSHTDTVIRLLAQNIQALVDSPE